MNLLENFVTKFSMEHKSSANHNENNNNTDVLTKTMNTKPSSYVISTAPSIDSNSIYTENASHFYSNTTPPISTVHANNDNFKSFASFTSFSNSNSPESNTCIKNSTNTTKSASNLTNSSINSSSKKTMRNMFSYSQIEILENIFEQTHYPDSTMREKLSGHLGINSSRIQVWFQNRRAKFRKFDLKNKKMSNTNSSKYNQQKSDTLISFNSTNNYFENDVKQINNNNTIESNIQYNNINNNNSSNNLSFSSTPSSISSSALTSSVSSSLLTPNTSSFNSGVILNDSLTNYLKNITHSAAQTTTMMNPSDEVLSNGYYYSNNHHPHHQLQNENANYGLQDYNEYQKQFYQNTNYHLYAHYQNDNNF